jgi:hypothetical protein
MENVRKTAAKKTSVLFLKELYFFSILENDFGKLLKITLYWWDIWLIDGYYYYIEE